MTSREVPQRTMGAHELYGDHWLNSDPVPIAALRGRILLLHFWDFTCTSSLRTVPYVREWQRKYETLGLSVIGVHRPRYKFARDPEIVFDALRRLQITYPVVLDNQHVIAGQYDVRSCPTLLVIDTHGFVRYICGGEGSNEQTEQLIQRYLYESGVRDILPVPMESLREEDKPGAILYKPTPELLAGYLEGNVGNAEGLSPESVVLYVDPGLYLDGRIYLEGKWMNGRDFFRLAETEGTTGRIFVKYHASEVLGVLVPEEGASVNVTVMQDGNFLSEDERGADIAWDADGRTYVNVTTPRVYSLVRNRGLGEHTLCLSASDNRLSVYSMAFTPSVVPETVSQG
jgi:hypothetical protein